MVSIFQSVNESRDNEDQSSSRTRKYSKDRTRPLTSEEEERLLGDSLGGRGVITSGLSVHTLSSGQGTGTLSSQGNTLNSVKSVRNYKRARPASTLNGDPLGAKKAGLCESEPHVYKVINRELILHKLLLAHTWVKIKCFRTALVPISVGFTCSIGPRDVTTCPDVSRSRAERPGMALDT